MPWEQGVLERVCMWKNEVENLPFSMMLQCGCGCCSGLLCSVNGGWNCPLVAGRVADMAAISPPSASCHCCQEIMWGLILKKEKTTKELFFSPENTAYQIVFFFSCLLPSVLPTAFYYTNLTVAVCPVHLHPLSLGFLGAFLGFGCWYISKSLLEQLYASAALFFLLWNRYFESVKSKISVIFSDCMKYSHFPFWKHPGHGGFKYLLTLLIALPGSSNLRAKVHLILQGLKMVSLERKHRWHFSYTYSLYGRNMGISIYYKALPVF